MSIETFEWCLVFIFLVITFWVGIDFRRDSKRHQKKIEELDERMDNILKKIISSTKFS